MGILDDDIAAFGRMRDKLEAEHLKEWVVFHKGQFEGIAPPQAQPARRRSVFASES